MNYQKYAEKAKAKISQYGSPCKVIRKDANEQYDEEKDEYIGTDTEINGSAIISTYSSSDIDGTNIKMGDVRIMCVLESPPMVEDRIQVGGKEYSILDVSELNIDGNTVIYYKVHGR